MSKCKVYPTLVVVAVVVSLTGLARASLINFDVDGAATVTWNSTGAVITQRISSSPAVTTMTAEFAPPSSGMSAAAPARSEFDIRLVAENDLGWTWTGANLDLALGDDAYFVLGSYSCPAFCEPVRDGGVAEPIHLEFCCTPGDPGVPDGGSTYFDFTISVLANSPYTFDLTLTPTPEPATLALFGAGALALVSRRRTT